MLDSLERNEASVCAEEFWLWCSRWIRAQTSYFSFQRLLSAGCRNAEGQHLLQRPGELTLMQTNERGPEEPNPQLLSAPRVAFKSQKKGPDAIESTRKCVTSVRATSGDAGGFGST